METEAIVSMMDMSGNAWHSTRAVTRISSPMADRGTSPTWHIFDVTVQRWCSIRVELTLAESRLSGP